ncbi:hypothetical protein ACP26L_15795 [Paenibacillus sp. S-38]|uniref:hypothetical protein n=1 Tax=Paenibacillus sp. S-38 TaxID=3416710 RepID=UPI003CE6C429
MQIRRGGTRDPLQPGEWIEVHYEEEEGEKQLQARFVEYQIFTEDRAAIVFIRVEYEEVSRSTSIGEGTPHFVSFQTTIVKNMLFDRQTW